jgi:hypothetical protein
MSNPFDAAPWKALQLKFKPRYAFEAQNLAEAKRWQRTLRRQFPPAAWRLSAKRDAAEARTSSRVALDGYTREEIRFSSREGLHVFGYFLLLERPPLRCRRYCVCTATGRE